MFIFKIRCVFFLEPKQKTRCFGWKKILHVCRGGASVSTALVGGGCKVGQNNTKQKIGLSTCQLEVKGNTNINKK
mgnify:CR=1 FL=1